MKTSKVILKIEQETINRGVREYVISRHPNGYLVFELGKLLEICLVIGGNERYAHRLNKTRKYGNQYGKYFRPIPFASIEIAMIEIKEYANINVWYF